MTPEQGSGERRPAGPDEDRGEALRADAQRPSSTPPHSSPPTGGASAEDPQGSGAGTSDAAARGRDAGAEVEADLDELAAAEQKRDEYLELAQRTKADFENYRKRTAAEVQAASARGKAELAAGLIGAIDNLERALEAAGAEPGAEAASDDPLSQGILLTYRELCGALERAGVESYDPRGERFDPSWHEALQKVAVDGSEPGTVVETVQKGYRLGDQVLRAARVVVSE